MKCFMRNNMSYPLITNLFFKLICRLYDAASHIVMARYEIHRILFYARGTAGSTETSCFAFTWSHGDTQESAIFQCHVFRCDIPEAVSIKNQLIDDELQVV
jgi:hypothetical protein